MSSALRELLAVFSIEVRDDDLKKAQHGIEGLTAKLGEFGHVLAGAFAVHEIAEFLHGQIEIGSQLNDLSDKLGVGVKDLQAFQYAGSLVGVSAEGAAHSLGFLNKTMGAAITGNAEAKQAFDKFHISLKGADGKVRNSADVMEDLADKVEGAESHAEKTAIAIKFLGRQGASMLPLFTEGAKGIRKMYDEFEALGGGMSEDFVHQADEAGDQLTRLKFVSQILKSELAVALLPAITKIATAFTNWIAWLVKVARQTNIVKAALFVFGVTGSFALLKVANAASKLLGLTASSSRGILGMVGSFAKLGVIVLLVAGLALIFEDLYTLMTGGKSVIGETLDELGLVGDKEALIESLKNAWAGIKQAFNDTKPVLIALGKLMEEGLVSSLPFIAKAIVEIAKGVAALVTGLVGLVQVIDKITDPTKSWDKVGTEIDKVGERIFGQKGIYRDDPRNFVPPTGPSSHPSPGAAAAQAQANYIVVPKSSEQNVIQTNKVDIKIEMGAGGKHTPEEVAAAMQAAVNAALEKQRADALAALAAGKVKK